MPRERSEAAAFPIAGLSPDAFPDGPARDAVKKFNAQLSEWHAHLSGGLSFGTGFNRHSGHMDGEIIEVVTTAFNSDFPVAHNLERLPVGVFQLVSEAPSTLFRRGTTPAHTSSLLWFVSAESVGTKYWILVF